MLTLIALLLLATLLALLVPVDIEFSAQRQERFRGQVAVHWLYGVIGGPLRCAPAKTKRRTEAKRRSRRPARSRFRIRSLFGNDALASRLLRLARRLLARIHLRQLRLHLRLGLDDPADTGRLWGLLGALTGCIRAPKASDVCIAPDFTGETFVLDCECQLRIVPLQILAEILMFALSPATWQALRGGTARR